MGKINYRIELAKPEQFAVYQVIYSNVDLEQWYDWNTRLKDTQFTNQCFWLLEGEQRIGGAIIDKDTVMYPFLITPFSDRYSFWKAMLSCNARIYNINGVIEQDADILRTFGYRIDRTRQVMCIPTESELKINIPEGFTLQTIEGNISTESIGEVIQKGYEGGIDNEVFGVPSFEEIIKDAEHLLEVYGYHNFSLAVIDEVNHRIAGACIAGIGEKMPLGFAEIGDICVLPEYRGRYLAEYNGLIN